MNDKQQTNEAIAWHTVYRYVGPGYLNAVPTRDLTGADLVEVQEREGIGRAEIEASGLYVAVDAVEVEPFCGAPRADGGRCKRKVARWGLRCYQHEEE